MSMSASYYLSQFLQCLRDTGTVLHGSNTQIAILLANGLDILDPASGRAAEDADTLARDLEVIAESLGGAFDYPEDEDEGEEDAD